MTNQKQNLMFNKKLNSYSQYFQCYSGYVVWIVIIKLEVQNLSEIFL